MQYYEILVGDQTYHGDSALTYAAEQELVTGSLVKVELRKKTVFGIVLKPTKKPEFKVKPIADVVSAEPVPTQILQLVDWLKSYYPAPIGSILKLFLPPTTAASRKSKGESAAKQPRPKVDLPPLTKEQTKALASIKHQKSNILHGITGSGKTRVYMELARKVLESGRSVIILTPEIGLTEPLAVAARTLPFENIVLHSRLTVAARRDLWFKLVSANEPQVIVGPRSALFAPLKNVGLIIMDESHDQAYKSDSTPNYRTERVAAVLAKLHQATFVAGSATPSVDDYYVAQQKNLPIINMESLAISSSSQPALVELIDLRDRSVFGRSKVLAQPLVLAIDKALQHSEQVLLFINRRGTASTILCSDCGWRALCPHCDLPLTYHGDSHALRCHVCGRFQSLPNACPDCQATDIVYKTLGTKAVVDEVTRLFPGAKIKRFDSDAPKSEQIEKQLSKIKAGDVDILIGTQMITKGLDLPKLSVVGVVNADSGLLVPDYSANERAYQQIHQVAGRIGRGHVAGRAFLQTYNPDHPVLKAAAAKNWADFYDNEIAERQSYRFPPFCFMLKLTCLRASSASAETAAAKLGRQISRSNSGVVVEGPAPAFHPKESGKYRWQIIVKSSSRGKLLDIIKTLPSGWRHDIDPINLL